MCKFAMDGMVSGMRNKTDMFKRVPKNNKGSLKNSDLLKEKMVKSNIEKDMIHLNYINNEYLQQIFAINVVFNIYLKLLKIFSKKTLKAQLQLNVLKYSWCVVIIDFNLIK